LSLVWKFPDFVEGADGATVSSMKSTTSSERCQIRLDRLALTGGGSSKVPRNIRGFKMSRDFRPRAQGKIATYGRVRTFCSTSNSARLSLQYQRVMPFLAPWRCMLIADDDDGITPDQVESVIVQCSSHKLTLAEFAVDFAEGGIVDRDFVLRHGKFGKTQRRKDRGGSGNLRYGSRQSPKLVRAYRKETLGCFRVELEIHSALLRKYRTSSGFELGRLAQKLVPAHIQFVGFRWEELQAYLVKKFGQQEGDKIFGEARKRADSSLQAATRFLSGRGVPNVHRFVSPLRLNLRLQKAIKCWAKTFSVSEELCG
jgi:hypothetical protein